MLLGTKRNLNFKGCLDLRDFILHVNPTNFLDPKCTDMFRSVMKESVSLKPFQHIRHVADDLEKREWTYIMFTTDSILNLVKRDTAKADFVELSVPQPVPRAWATTRR